MDRLDLEQVAREQGELARNAIVRMVDDPEAIRELFDVLALWPGQEGLRIVQSGSMLYTRNPNSIRNG